MNVHDLRSLYPWASWAARDTEWSVFEYLPYKEDDIWVADHGRWQELGPGACVRARASLVRLSNTDMYARMIFDIFPWAQQIVREGDGWLVRPREVYIVGNLGSRRTVIERQGEGQGEAE